MLMPMVRNRRVQKLQTRNKIKRRRKKKRRRKAKMIRQKNPKNHHKKPKVNQKKPNKSLNNIKKKKLHKRPIKNKHQNPVNQS